MFRTILRFGAALRFEECRLLERELAMIKFDKGDAREQAMTYPYALAFIIKARELAANGVIPEWRARSMALGTAAQFELLLRQKDIIGQWDKAKPNAPNAIYFQDEMWTGFFVRENVHGWVWRLKTSKSNYKKQAPFTLSNYSLLYPMLQEVPHAERTGPIVKGEHGLPMRERSYRKWFRQIARAAGIPDEVWSMDSRAGGATEAEQAGAPRTAIQANLTHSGADMTGGICVATTSGKLSRSRRRANANERPTRLKKIRPAMTPRATEKASENKVRIQRQNTCQNTFYKPLKLRMNAGRGSRI
jgi:hypothetical protein